MLGTLCVRTYITTHRTRGTGSHCTLWIDMVTTYITTHHTRGAGSHCMNTEIPVWPCSQTHRNSDPAGTVSLSLQWCPLGGVLVYFFSLFYNYMRGIFMQPTQTQRLRHRLLEPMTSFRFWMISFFNMSPEPVTMEKQVSYVTDKLGSRIQEQQTVVTDQCPRQKFKLLSRDHWPHKWLSYYPLMYQKRYSMSIYLWL